MMFQNGTGVLSYFYGMPVLQTLLLDICGSVQFLCPCFMSLTDGIPEVWANWIYAAASRVSSLLSLFPGLCLQLQHVDLSLVTWRPTKNVCPCFCGTGVGPEAEQADLQHARPRWLRDWTQPELGGIVPPVQLHGQHRYWVHLQNL